MLVSRKKLDAAAALSSGGGVLLIAVGVKPVPQAISYLGFMDVLWGVLMAGSCLGAAAGALLRSRDPDAYTRRYWSAALERISWPGIAASVSLFCLGVVAQYGVVDAALTLGFTGFVIFTCAGHWWVIQQAAKEVRR